MSRRHQPVQKRSQETIEAILNSAAQLLGELGYRETSTNKIAKHAHVSIGTVYRYFTDKDAVILALRTRAEDAAMRDLVIAIGEALSMETSVGAEHILTALVNAIESHGAVLTAMINDVPLGIYANIVPGIEKQLYHLARYALMQREPDLTDQDVDEILYLGMGAMLHLALRIAIERPAGVSKESLIQRAVAMIPIPSLFFANSPGSVS
ncbi:TetR/AcrR family transcriptional regulator [Mycobacterium sp. NPDC050853]|uniref:TetR/AcrR family transcriptional regulator n=1 Tax=Mycobacterium sp. NPDC050853 TaxID=3155160 RepID=UPI00340769A9